ncbi:membrane-associated oxidoreductase [Streptomyces coffeae]|uniref:Membrane-associated oxidoreductase n=1 Tax=Streptomyces coffeae TaxID=621382 RepID=A0ABS1NDZ7_9ACTN|nr:membrane-associated oxidoreductase [Streptomyces coffeae]MBL1098314.1 membrane-associated oxidoreductase [Streptomyces coffeae]
MDITDLTPLERRIWQAFPRGLAIDVRRDGREDPATIQDAERTVRAEVIRTLILGGSSASGEAPALRVAGAAITGVLDLQHAEIRHPIRLTSCHFQHSLELDGTQTRQLDFSGSHLPALAATSLRVDGALRLTNCRIAGSVRLSNAEISGGVFLDGAHLGSGDGWALQLDHASVGADVWAPGLVAQGGIRLGTAHVEGAVDLEDGQVKNANGDALDAARLTVGTVLNAGGLTAEGRVRLTGAKVAGWISFIEARLSNPGGVALGISSCEATQLTLRDARPVSGDVKMHYASFKVIEAEPQVWPTKVRLEGLTYETLTPRLPSIDRLALLQRDSDGFVPHSYEQLAASYRRVGDDADARTVLLAKQRRRRATLPWYARLWGYLQDATVGYGFRPTRAGGWLLALLLLGSVAFGMHHPPPVEHGKGPGFNAPIYTLDLLLPIVDFGQQSAFAPAGLYQWLSYLLIAVGWVLATTVAAGITRTLSRQ